MEKKYLVLALMIVIIPLLAVISYLDSYLRVPAAPMGIVSFEFCGFENSCGEILTEWGQLGREVAMLLLGLDYLFPVIYSGLICISILWLSEGLPSRFDFAIRVAAALSIAAGVSDGAENASLIYVIMSSGNVQAAHLASWFALLKFIMLGFAISALVVLMVWRVLGLSRRSINR